MNKANVELSEDNKRELEELRVLNELSKKDIVCKCVGQVEVCNNVLDVHLVDWLSDPGLNGKLLTQSGKIYLNKQLSPINQMITLVHEMMHHMYYEHQLYRPMIDIHEQIIEALDAPITADLIMSQHNSAFFNRVLAGEFSSLTPRK